MSLEIVRLHLGLFNVTEEQWPVHGFVVKHPRLGAVLVDTGMGGPEETLRDFRVVNRGVADALAEHGMSPADIQVVINTHLHFDHCGQNAVFPHAPIYVQRTELERARRESPELKDWLDYAGARYELLDGDADLGDGLRLMLTPGHTVGHQSVTVGEGETVTDVMVGDAVFTVEIYDDPSREDIPDLQYSDRAAWANSLDRIKRLHGSRVHFCHDTRPLKVGSSVSA